MSAGQASFGGRRSLYDLSVVKTRTENVQVTCTTRHCGIHMIASSIGGQRLKPLAKCRWFTLIGILDAVYPSGVPVDVHRASFDAVIRRFLLHTLPDGFHRIRHFGFMANGCRAQSSPCVGPLFSNKSSAPRPRLTRLRRLKQTSALPRAPNAAASCALSPRFCALQIEAFQTVGHSGAIRHEDRWYADEGHEAHLSPQRRRPACRRRHVVPASALVFGVGP